MDESGGLESVPKALAGHITTRGRVELVVHEWHEFLQGRLIALAPSSQETRDFVRRYLTHKLLRLCNLPCAAEGITGCIHPLLDRLRTKTPGQLASSTLRFTPIETKGNSRSGRRAISQKRQDNLNWEVNHETT